MRAKTNNLPVYIVLIMIVVGIAIYLIINSMIKGEYKPDFLLEDFYVKPLEKIGVNEYKVSHVTEDDMINIYFNSYVMMFFENLDKSYDYLNEEYKNAKFSSKEDYRTYVSSITDDFKEIPKIDKYNKETKGNKIIYTILDTKGNKYIFSVSGVMMYEVYFDEDTIQIQ